MGQLWDRLNRFARSQFDATSETPSRPTDREHTAYADFDYSSRSEFEEFDKALHGQHSKSAKATQPSAELQEIHKALQVLRVDPGPPLPTYEHVKTVYRRLMKQYHPDRYTASDPKAEEYRKRAAEVNAAWEFLERVLTKTKK